MINPELFALPAVAARCALRLMDALAERIVLRGQINLVQAATANNTTVDVTDTSRHGHSRHIRIEHPTDHHTRRDHQDQA